ncbi:hypothetical protein FRC12_016165 [Ceratobasidium sp. 428]|nr:hypothetical protein FRC12_016165 [Ceratobasidium sp. 428]
MPCNLPTEILLNILSLAIWKRQAHSSALTPLTKHTFPSDFSLVSKWCRELLFEEWFYLLVLHSPQDLEHPVFKKIRTYVRALTLKEGALVPRIYIKTLNSAHFEGVHTVTLDCHHDVGCSSSDNGKGGQWSYKKIMPHLPRGLKSLIVLNAHGPDLQIIQQAVTQCPDLEHLCLGRCTKFNRLGNCAFWDKFPDDHDSYFSNKGVEGYAKALGTELQRLKKLKAIYVNVYLTDTKYLCLQGGCASEAVESTPQTPPSQGSSRNASSERVPAQLPVSNSQASEESAQPVSDKEYTTQTEKSAVSTLFECHDALQNAAFISYWSPNHLSWSSHDRDTKQITQIPYIASHLALSEPGGQSFRSLDNPKASPNVDI